MNELTTINRCLVMVIPKQPFIEWENSVFPDLPMNPEDIIECNSYLIQENSLFDEPKAALKKYWKKIFEEQLVGICTDKSKWPKQLTWKLFSEWFDCRFSSMVIDLEKEPLYMKRFG